MEDALWHLLASSRGGPSMVRVLEAIDKRPRNANQLAADLDLDYTTVGHHLDRLTENNVVRSTGNEDGAVYPVTDQGRSNWDVVEEFFEAVDPG